MLPWLENSAEIDNATARLMKVYELDGPATSSSVRSRFLAYLDGMNAEIEVDVRSMWPSPKSACAMRRWRKKRKIAHVQF